MLNKKREISVSVCKSVSVAAGAIVCLTHLPNTPLHAQTALSIGDISVAGVNTDSPDGFSVVLWRDIASGTVMKFTDNSFKRTANTTGAVASNAVFGSEEFVVMTATSMIPAGTVIRFVNAGGGASNLTLSSGTATSTGALSGLSASGDQVFVYQGSGSGSNISGSTAIETFSGTILYGLNTNSGSWSTSGSDNSTTNISFLPKELADAAVPSNIDLRNSLLNAYYSGATSGLTATVYRAAVANRSNWTSSASNQSLPTTAFTIGSNANLYWRGSGNGFWDTTTSNQFGNLADNTFFKWVNSDSSNHHTAVFAGTPGVISIAASGVTASGLAFNVSGYTIDSNTVTLEGSTFHADVPNVAHTATISSTLAGNSTTTFSKSGNGALVLSGNNSYTGTTTVSGGTLSLVHASSTNNIASSPSITVQTGANLDVSGIASGFALGADQTLKGSGTVHGNTSANPSSASRISPGSTGKLTFNGDLTLNTNATYQVQVGGDGIGIGAAGTDFDQIVVTGSDKLLTLGTASLKILPMPGIVIGQPYRIVNTTNGASVVASNIFKNLTQNLNAGGPYTEGNVTYNVAYGYGSGGYVDITFSAVPEPTSMRLTTLCGTLLLRRRRRN